MNLKQMNLKQWNWLMEISCSLLFALWISILFQPWIIVLNNQFKFAKTPVSLFFWIFYVLIAGVIIEKNIQNIAIKKRNILFLSIFLFNIFLLKILSWPLLVFIPFFIIMLLLSFRYEFYQNSSAFIFDFGVGTLILIFNILINYFVSLQINIYIHLLSFFIIGICLAFLINLRKIKIYEDLVHPRLILITIIFSLFAVIIPGFLLGIFMNTSFFQGILNLIKFVIRGISFVYLILLYPVVRALYPIIGLIMEFFDLNFLNLEDMAQKNGGSSGETFRKVIEKSLNNRFMQYIPYILWTLLIMFLIWIVYLILKKIIRDRKNQKLHSGYKEEKESVFSWQELKYDINFLWKKININKNKKLNKTYETEDPSQKIRKIYYYFLLKFNKIRKYRNYYTPREYNHKLIQKLNQKIPQLNTLTFLYNKTRYGSQIDAEDVKQAEEIWKFLQNLDHD